MKIIVVTLFLNALVLQLMALPTYEKLSGFERFYNYTREDGLISYRFTDIAQDKHGFLWLATRDGLMRFDGYDFSLYTHSFASNTIPDDFVYSLALDSLGNFWVGTLGGLCKYNYETDDFERVHSFFGEDISGGAGIRKLYVDEEGFLWILKQGGILIQVDLVHEIINQYSVDYHSNETIYHHFVLRRFDDLLFLGGSGMSELKVFNVAEKKWIPDFIKDAEPPVISGSIADVLDIGDDYWYFANYATNAYRVHKETLEFETLPFSSLYAFLCNHDGRFWFGGYGRGVNLYDPVRGSYQNFNNEEANPYSLAGDQVYKIYRDHQDNIWFASNGGLSVLSPFRNQYTLLHHIPGLDALPSNKIRALMTDVENEIWMGTHDKGLIRYKDWDGSFAQYNYYEHPDSISSNRLTSVALGDSNTVWVSLWNGRGSAVNSFSKSDRKFTRYRTSDDYYWNSAVLQHSSGRLLVGSWGSGLNILKEDGSDYESPPFFIFDLSIPVWVRNRYIQDFSSTGWYSAQLLLTNAISGEKLFLIPVNPRNLFFSYALPPENIVVLEPEGAFHNPVLIDDYAFIHFFEGQLYQLNLLTKDTLSISGKLGKTVRNIWKDNAHLYYSTEEGIYLWDYINKQSTPLLESSSLGFINNAKSHSTGLLVSFANALVNIHLQENTKNAVMDTLLREKTGKILFKNGVYFMSSLKGLWVLDSDFQIMDTLFSNQNIKAITPDSLNRLWVSTDRGLFRKELKNNEITQIKAEPWLENGLPSDDIHSLGVDVLGRVWIANDLYFSVYDPNTNEYVNHRTPSEKALSSHLVTDMIEDREGFVWLSFSDPMAGINRVDITERRVEHFIPLTYDSLSYPRTSTWTIFQAECGTILSGTDDGLMIMQGRENHFIRIDQSHGLPHKRVRAISQDASGLIWVGTDMGFATFNLETHEVKIRSRLPGALKSFIYDIKPWGSDKMVIGGEGGVNIIPTHTLSADTMPIPLVLTRVLLDGKSLALTPSNYLEVPASHKSLEISFVGLDYRAPQNIEYAYVLRGFSDSLTPVNPLLRKIYFGKLPHGKFSLEIHATNADGVWNTNPLLLSVFVDKPYYFKSWFFVLVLLVSASLFYGLLKWREKLYAHENQRLDALVQKRTSQIHTQKEEIQAQHDFIERQSNDLKQTHLHLTDSIEYALSLQKALMPSKESLQCILGDLMLIFKAQDMVSGDFYWVKGDKDRFRLALADCTGHGVHGGFMSMMGMTYVNETDSKGVIQNPKEHLVSVHRKFYSAFHLEQADEFSVMSLGMDITLCYLDRTQGVLQMAGTGMAFYLLSHKDGKPVLQSFAMGKRQIATIRFEEDVPLNTIPVKSGDKVYLLTDGVFDQLSHIHFKRFSRLRFEKLLMEIHHLPFDEQSHKIETALNAWKGEGVQTDDMAILAFEV